MKAGAKLDDSGFKMKMKQLKGLDTMFKQLPSHYALFFMGNMIDWELNFNPVGRISGNLARSPQVQDRPYSATMRINATGQAPYAESVNAKTTKNYGNGIIDLARLRLATEMMKEVKAEWHRAVNNIEAGKSYIYRNPFYS